MYIYIMYVCIYRIANSTSPKDILKIFRLFDLNDSGSIRLADLQVCVAC